MCNIALILVESLIMPVPLRVLICIIASVYFVYSIHLLRSYRYLCKHGAVTTGELIGWQKVYRDWHWQPLVQFKTNRGRRIIIKPSYLWYHVYPYLRHGQLLGIVYDPNYPQNALVTSVVKLDWYALMIAVLALIGVFVGVAEQWILVILNYLLN